MAAAANADDDFAIPGVEAIDVPITPSAIRPAVAPPPSMPGARAAAPRRESPAAATPEASRATVAAPPARAAEPPGAPAATATAPREPAARSGASPTESRPERTATATTRAAPAAASGDDTRAPRERAAARDPAGPGARRDARAPGGEPDAAAATAEGAPDAAAAETEAEPKPRKPRRVRRAHHDEEHENHERWLVSYADFITLLFAFFVVMYAISSVNEGKYRVLSDALVSAFSTAQNPLPGKGEGESYIEFPIKEAARAQKRRQEQAARALAENLQKSLEPLAKDGQVKITETPRGLAVDIKASALFASGQAEIAPTAVVPLGDVARLLAQVPNTIQVEGHTDNAPISSAVFPSNWELSAARASRVVRLFEQFGVPPSRMSALGFGEHRAIDSNDSPDGRSRNRRVTVMILRSGAEGGTP
jgi:chemotaxis protein MotB